MLKPPINVKVEAFSWHEPQCGEGDNGGEWYLSAVSLYINWLKTFVA